MKKMKYIVLVADGMADLPIEELGNRTPLEVARTPNMDKMAVKGKIGEANFVPEGLVPGSDVANLAILGYDPKKYYCGRGALEANNLGIKLASDEVAFRCNLVTVEDDILVEIREYDTDFVDEEDLLFDEEEIPYLLRHYE